MNIVMLVSSMGSGGAERVASTLVNAWAKRGDTVTLVVTYSGRGTCFYPLADNVRLIYLADLAGRNRRGLRGYAARFAALRAFIRSSRPDVVISFLTNVNVTAILASSGLHVPVIACEHNDPSADGRSRFWRLACRFVYPRASLVTLLTDNVVAPFRQMVPRMPRLAVMPNPLPDELFEQPRAHTPANGRKRLISVGRLHEQKQYDVLIAAFAALADAFRDWDLWIWGDGPERAKLEAQIKDAGLGARVFLPGKTASPWTEMAGAEIFALSSRFEGLPMALMEAMGLGVAAIAFDCRSGPRELTRDGSDGVLIPPGDVEAMVRGLRQLIADDALRVELGRKAAHSIRERYSVQAVLTLWDALFAQVGARAAPPAARRPGMAGIGGTANGAATRSKLDLREPALEKSRRVNEEPT
jgi:glycosyltransferase involved in cell wall biosynthesis